MDRELTTAEDLSQVLLGKICAAFESELDGWCKEIFCDGEIDLEEMHGQNCLLINFNTDQTQLEDLDNDDRCGCTFPYALELIIVQPLKVKPIEKESGFVEYADIEEIRSITILAEKIRDFVCCCPELRGQIASYLRDLEAGAIWQQADGELKPKGIIQSSMVVTYLPRYFDAPMWN